jgi:uncharacterized protein YndB with AHSA1/START domain
MSAFVYVTYIRASRERVWEALTVPSFIKRYWFGMDVESDFRAGSTWKLQFEDGRIADHGEILDSEPPRKGRRAARSRWRRRARRPS